MRAWRYLRTAAHLQPKQLLYWTRRRLLARRRPVRLALVIPPTASAGQLDALSVAVRSLGPGSMDARLHSAQQVASSEFTFLNQTRSIRDVDWHSPGTDRLWAYNLKYFDYAVNLAWAFQVTGERRYLVALQKICGSFLDALHGDGLVLEPYPTSVRLINWMQVWLLVGDDLEPEFQDKLVASLRAQLTWLERNCEYHILANHLLKNVQALAIGSLLFSDTAARRWRMKYLPILWEQVCEQINPDGCHYERSPMYHAEALGDLLLSIALLQAAGEPVPAFAKDRLRGMSRALAWLSRPDGTLHLFNDSANEGSPQRGDLFAMSAAVLDTAPDDVSEPLSLPDTGYYGVVSPDGRTRFIIDGGEPTPKYQPGHAHCGLLSFELDWDSQPVVVDAGVHGYDGDPYREYVRSTRAHNTVTVGGLEQSEVWDAFRVARRARLISADAEGNPSEFRFSGCYRPYHDRRCRHTRDIVLTDEDLTVTDHITGCTGSEVVSYLHFHPAFTVELDGETAMARSEDVAVRVEPYGFDRIELIRGSVEPLQGWYCPRFGEALASPVIEMTVCSNRHSKFGYVLRRSGD